jgi:hypothetical protein
MIDDGIKPATEIRALFRLMKRSVLADQSFPRPVFERVCL